MASQTRTISFDPAEAHRCRGGGTPHEVRVDRTVFLRREPVPGGLTGDYRAVYMELETPAVALANVEDGEYVQHFRGREEIEAFIARLRTAADEAWGPATVGHMPNLETDLVLDGNATWTGSVRHLDFRRADDGEILQVGEGSMGDFSSDGCLDDDNGNLYPVRFTPWPPDPKDRP